MVWKYLTRAYDFFAKKSSAYRTLEQESSDRMAVGRQVGRELINLRQDYNSAVTSMCTLRRRIMFLGGESEALIEENEILRMENESLRKRNVASSDDIPDCTII